MKAKTLRVVARYTDGHGSGKTATSAATSAVASANTELTFSTGAPVFFNRSFGLYYTNLNKQVPAAWMETSRAGQLAGIQLTEGQPFAGPSRSTASLLPAIETDLEISLTVAGETLTVTNADENGPGYNNTLSGTVVAAFLSHVNGATDKSGTLTLSTGAI